MISTEEIKTAMKMGVRIAVAESEDLLKGIDGLTYVSDENVDLYKEGYKTALDVLIERLKKIKI